MKFSAAWPTITFNPTGITVSSAGALNYMILPLLILTAIRIPRLGALPWASFRPHLAMDALAIG
jgi:hypothetical protein